MSLSHNKSLAVGRKIVLFDVDGTLIDHDNRLIFLLTEPRNERAFRAGSVKDPAIPQILNIAQMMSDMDEYLVFIVTARSEHARRHTEAWMEHNEVYPREVVMKKNGDKRSDDKVKRDHLKYIREEYGEPFMVFDDRDTVNKMWVEEGVYLLDVSQKRIL